MRSKVGVGFLHEKFFKKFRTNLSQPIRIAITAIIDQHAVNSWHVSELQGNV